MKKFTIYNLQFKIVRSQALLAIISLLAFLLLNTTPVLALNEHDRCIVADLTNGIEDNCDKAADLFCKQTIPINPNTPSAGTCEKIPGVNISKKFGFGTIKSLGEATSKLVPAIFSLASAVVIIFFLWGAFKFIQSQGDKEELAKARQMITHAIIGFLILIFVFLILPFLLSSLFNIKGLQLF